MLRGLLTIIPVVGLVACLVLWVASYTKDWHFRVLPGALVVTMWQYAPSSSLERSVLQDIAEKRSRFRTSWWRGSRLRGDRYAGAVLYVPLLPLAIVLTTISAFCLSPIHRRHKRRKRGLCVKCGYDLRGSTDRCPECGEHFDEKLPGHTRGKSGSSLLN